MLRGDREHWGSLAKAFHWTIVVLLLVQGTIGLVMVQLPKRPSVIPVFDFHKSLGLSILALAVLRLAWRAFDARPDFPATMPPRQALAARTGHALLYLLLFAVPLTGWWFDSVAALRPLHWFGLVEVPHLTGPDPDLKHLAAETHEILFWMLIAVAAGHAAIALLHQFVTRDGVLARMWPDALQRARPVPSPSVPEIGDVPANAAAAAVDPARDAGDRA
jgi:cytochrome b561